MKKNMATKLVRALRSGNYKQGTRRLVSHDDEFCCLGVACDISRVELEWEELYYRDWCIGGEFITLPTAVMEEFGFAKKDGERRDGKMLVIGDRKYWSLSDANDDGESFSDIADYIEANYKEL